MLETMTSAAHQFDPEETGEFPTPEDLEQAINNVTTNEEKYRQVEEKWGIKPVFLNQLESQYPGIGNQAIMQSKNPTQYERALKELLQMIKEELKVAEKLLPYEKPKVPFRMPLKVAKMIYPELEVQPDKSDLEILKDLYRDLDERTARVKNLTEFFDEEEKRISDPAYGAKKMKEEKEAFEKALASYRKNKPSDVVTSVQGDVESLLTAKPNKAAEPVDLDEADYELIEEAPATVKQGRKSA